MRPILAITVDAKSNIDRWKIDVALTELSQLDKTFSHRTDPESGHVIVAGESEQRLRQLIHRVLHERSATAELGKPQVIYYESICAKAQAEGKYIRPANYAHVKILIEPKNPAEDYEFSNKLGERELPPPLLHAIDEGIQDAMRGGVLAGRELVGLKATLFDASFHATDSNELSFRIAAAMALKEAARKAKPILLEPMMSVEIICPAQTMGAIIHDLNDRQGRIEEMNTVNEIHRIEATVPLRTMLTYEADIRSTMQIRVTCTMQFKRYEASPIRLL